MSNIFCPVCGKENLICYEEQIITEERKINKDNTISKRKKINPISDNGASGIMCLDCNNLFDYDTDDKGENY